MTTTDPSIPQLPKFGRTYQLVVQPNVQAAKVANNPQALPLVITLPLTMEFDVTRNILNKANDCQIRVWNLGLLTRNQIRFDRTNYDNLSYRGVILKAGYGLNQAVVFSGNISRAYSVREGVNYVTTIECYQGGSAYINARTNRTFIARTPYQTIVQELVASLNAYGVGVGAIGAYPGSIQRDTTYSDNTVALLRNLTGGGFFIDQGKANCLNNSEYIANMNGITTVSSNSGLLGTPTQEAQIINFDMIFEPKLNAGQLVNLQSHTENNFNGMYKCISVKHRGMISPAVCGDVTTSVGLWNVKSPIPVQSQ